MKSNIQKGGMTAPNILAYHFFPGGYTCFKIFYAGSQEALSNQERQKSLADMHRLILKEHCVLFSFFFFFFL